MSVLSGFIKTIKYRLTDAGYKWQSEKTSSQTVVMGDGTDNTDTVESRFGNIKGITTSTTESETGKVLDASTYATNVGAIQGITSSLATDNKNYALSASAGKDLQDQITDVNSSLNNKANTSTVIALQTSVNAINTKLASGYVGKDVKFQYKGAWENVDTGSFKLMYVISDGGTIPIIIPCNISTGTSSLPHVIKNNDGTAIFQYFISNADLYVYVLNNGSTVGVNFIL